MLIPPICIDTDFHSILKLNIDIFENKIHNPHKNTHNFIAKPDKKLLKSGFNMKFTEIWLLEVPLITCLQILGQENKSDRVDNEVKKEGRQGR